MSKAFETFSQDLLKFQQDHNIKIMTINNGHADVNFVTGGHLNTPENRKLNKSAMLNY